ncbi:MAG TPA: hypothetical protein VNU44_14425 [Bryobacteraceae bacterium]|nr:hypothetical protein [Bryobacteraceae bacterium]
MITDEKRTNTGITIQPSLRDEVTDYARREEQTFSRFTCMVLRWALDEMKKNGITCAELKSWHVAPPSAAERKKRRRAAEPPSR